MGCEAGVETATWCEEEGDVFSAETVALEIEISVIMGEENGGGLSYHSAESGCVELGAKRADGCSDDSFYLGLWMASAPGGHVETGVGVA